MNGIVLFAVAALGVDYGWQPTADGNLEYIIQIEPELLAALEEGTPITSEIATPPDAGRITCFRVKVGSGQVPRDTPVRPVGYQDGQPATNQVDQYGRPILKRPAQWVGDPNQYNQLANQHGYTNPPATNDGGLADRPHIWPQSTPQTHTGGTLLAAPTDNQHRATVDATTPAYRRPYSDAPQTQDYVTAPRRQVGFGDDPAADRYAALPPKTGTVLRTTGTDNRVYGSYRTEAEKPWWPLFFTTTALFLSIGGNAYLAWMAAEFYSRYRDTIDRLRAVERRT
jgi:hypothetical protein